MQPAPALSPITYTGIDPMTITLVGGMVVTIITTIVSGVVTIITAMRVTHVSTQQRDSVLRMDTLAKDTEAIKGHVNSEKTASDGRETALKQEVLLLREMIADKKATADLLAQSVALASGRTHAAIPIVVPAGAVPLVGARPVGSRHEDIEAAKAVAADLHKTAENTEAIKENTARTDKQIEALKDKV